MEKKIKIAVVMLMVCLFLSGVCVRAWAEEQEFILRPEPVLAGGANRLALNFNIQHARVSVKLAEDADFIIKVLVKYDSEALEPVSSENFSEGTFRVGFSSGSPAAQNATNSVHDWEIQIGRYNLETDLVFDFAGVQARMDLGGMPLNTLMLNLKGTRTKLDFSEPTPFSVRKFGITCAGTFLTLADIGNTGFETFQLKAIGSSVDLDYAGTYVAGDYNADFSLSGSSAIISLPATAGALVVHRPANPSVELAGGGWSGEKTSEGYMTDDYEAQQSKLNLYMVSTAASVLIRRDGTDLQYQLSY